MKKRERVLHSRILDIADVVVVDLAIVAFAVVAAVVDAAVAAEEERQEETEKVEHGDATTATNLATSRTTAQRSSRDVNTVTIHVQITRRRNASSSQEERIAAELAIKQKMRIPRDRRRMDGHSLRENTQ